MVHDAYRSYGLKLMNWQEKLSPANLTRANHSLRTGRHSLTDEMFDLVSSDSIDAGRLTATLYDSQNGSVAKAYTQLLGTTANDKFIDR
jgi:hypothetical protein